MVHCSSFRAGRLFAALASAFGQAPEQGFTASTGRRQSTREQRPGLLRRSCCRVTQPRAIHSGPFRWTPCTTPGSALFFPPRAVHPLRSSRRRHKAGEPAPTLPAATEKPQVTLVGTVRSAGVQMGFPRPDRSVAAAAARRPVRPRMDRAWRRSKSRDAREGGARGEARTAGARHGDRRRHAARRGRDRLEPHRSERPNSRHPVGRIKPFATAERYR